MDKKKFQRALDKFNKALDEMQELAGIENFNFVAAITVFDEKGDATEDSCWYAMGAPQVSVISAECLVEEIKDNNHMELLMSEINLN